MSQLAATARFAQTQSAFLCVALGVLALVVYFFDNRIGFLIIGALLLLIGLAGGALRVAKVGATGFTLEFQQRVASEIRERAQRPRNEDVPITDAAIEAALRALAAAPTAETFTRLLAEFLELRWRSAPVVTTAAHEGAPEEREEFEATYAGESAFITIRRGEVGQFIVVYANTGTKTWTRGTATEAQLRVPPNKPDHRTFALGWAAERVYATQTQDVIAPGQMSAFAYNVAVPEHAAAGVYRFWFQPATRHGALADDGGYQDLRVID